MSCNINCKYILRKKTCLKKIHDLSSIPVSIDSSNPEIIKAGLEEYDNHMRPMVNSLSLERKDLIDTIVNYDAQVVVSAASESSMPSFVYFITDSWQ